MKVKRINGLWFVSRTRKDGSIAMGYAPKLLESIKYCMELA